MLMSGKIIRLSKDIQFAYRCIGLPNDFIVTSAILNQKKKEQLTK